MKKRWRIKDYDHNQLEQLQKELPIHPILCRLLVQRGITNYDEAKKFFRPSIDHLHDPFLMKDMKRAVERIVQALKQQEKILVYGDYDVDGTTSVALLYAYLTKSYEKVDFYIPDRYEEGYGVSHKAVEWAHKKDISLIIALDCGIKAGDKVAKAKQYGIDFIICDHHQPGDNIPSAHAVLDPKRTDCTYPYQELSGCGIGFKLIQALQKNRGKSIQQLTPYLDLVAISIASDIVPITGENRVLAQLGLKVLNKSPAPGLKALMELTNLWQEDVNKETGEVTKKTITVSDIVFRLGPRINAAGRMDDARHAVNTLIAKNEEEALNHAEKLQVKNTERQKYDKRITEEAARMINTEKALQERKTTVLYNPDWHKGVIGIVASRLIEDHYYRPTVLLTESQGTVTGSARSVAGFDLYEALDACSEWLEQFGGHKYAAGLTISKDNIKAFSEQFEKVVSESIPDHLLTPEVKIDAELDLHDITPEFFNILRQFAPFGPGNMRPVFMTKQVRDAGHSRIVGKDENHLKLSIQQNGSATLYGIGFDKGNFYDNVSARKPFDICYTLMENYWKGRTSIELNAKDLRF